jgi:uncharacterized protein
MVYDKNLLVNYRIKRADETLDEALLSLANNKLNLTANRIYYAGFYIVSALAISNDFSTSKHSQLLGWFNKNIVKKGKVPKEFGKIYLNAYELRQEGDYEDLIEFDKKVLAEKLKEIEKFVNVVKEIIP